MGLKFLLVHDFNSRLNFLRYIFRVSSYDIIFEKMCYSLFL